MFKQNIINIKNHKYFDDLYCLALSLFALLFWCLNSMTGFVFFLVIGCLALIFLKEIKYLVPIIIYIPFINSAIFTTSVSYIPITLIGAVFLLSLVAFLLINKMKIKLDKNSLPLLIMAVLILLPILWIDKEFSGNGAMVLYLCGILYYIIYLIFRSSQTKMMGIVISTHIFLPLLLTGQLIVTILTTPNWLSIFPKIPLLLGWGIGNEVAILICVSMPFVFYKLLTDKNKIIPLILLMGCVFGIALTFSRAGYLIGALEFITLLIYTLHKLDNKLFKKITIISIGVLSVVALIITFRFNLLSSVFDDGLSSNGRIGLYLRSIDYLTENVLNFILGSGFISEIKAERITVWHSTLFQTLAVGGITLFGVLLYHFYKKYMPLIKNKSPFAIITIIGFIFVDLYGLIDNTYYMYYFMIPLVIFLSALDNELDDFKLIKEDE